jgi:hypothetical protein
MRQFGDIAPPKDGVICLVPMDLFGMPVSLLRVLKRLPGAFLPGLVILLLMGFRGGKMRVGGDIVQLGASSMILVWGCPPG